MSIYKRKKSRFWWYAISRGRSMPALCGSTGKVDRNDALAVEAVMRQAYAGQTPRDRLVATIDALMGGQRVGLPLTGVWDAYHGWLDRSGKGLADSTVMQRRRVLARFVKWAGVSWPAAAVAGAVDRSCANGYAEYLAKRGVSSKTRRNDIADLGTVWEGLRRVRDDVTVNPWPLVLPAAESERIAAFTAAEEEAVMKAADAAGHGWGLASRISRFTGLRYGDVARLCWAQVDFERNAIRLRPGKTARHGIGVVLPLCSELREALSAARGGATGDDVLPEHAVCYPRPEKGVPGAFSKVLKAAAVDGRHTFHSWRHTFRTRLAEAGVSDELAKRLGGWTVDKTALRYDHDGRLAELAAAVEAGAKIGPVEKKSQG